MGKVPRQLPEALQGEALVVQSHEALPMFHDLPAVEGLEQQVSHVRQLQYVVSCCY